MLSVIITTLNESNSLSAALQALLATVGKDAQFEIILCDGGSRDDSLEQADHFPVTILNTSRGRAQQMNAGARQARGEWLVFLHVDTRLPDSWMSDINNCGSAWGRFDIELSGTHWLFRVIEQAMNFRSRTIAVATGDQVLFFRRDFFWHIGGIDGSFGYANLIQIVAYPGDLTAVFLGCPPKFACLGINDIDTATKSGKSNPIGLGHVIVVRVAGIVNR